MPGARFKRIAASWKKSLEEVVNKPYDFVKQQMAQRTNKPSYLSKLLEQNNGILSPEEDTTAKWSATTLYGAGADTVS